MTNLVLLGPPGCGKGTQSKILVDTKQYFQVSTGDLLRKSVNSGSKQGIAVKKIMEKGELVPDSMVIEMLLDVIKKHKKKSFIFDGFPRNINQAEQLEKSFNKNKTKINFVIFINVNLDILEERIKKRIEESDQNNVREDDNINTLLKRVEIYKEMTLPLLDYYKRKDLLWEIDGMQPIDVVSKNIKEIIAN